MGDSSSAIAVLSLFTLVSDFLHVLRSTLLSARELKAAASARNGFGPAARTAHSRTDYVRGVRLAAGGRRPAKTYHCRIGPLPSRTDARDPLPSRTDAREFCRCLERRGVPDTDRWPLVPPRAELRRPERLPEVAGARPAHLNVREMRKVEPAQRITARRERPDRASGGLRRGPVRTFWSLPSPFRPISTIAALAAATASSSAFSPR